VGVRPEWWYLINCAIVDNIVVTGHLPPGGGVPPTSRGPLADPPVRYFLELGVPHVSDVMYESGPNFCMIYV